MSRKSLSAPAIRPTATLLLREPPSSSPLELRSARQLKTASVIDQDQAKRELLKSVLGLGAAGLGVGAGARGLAGLFQLASAAKPQVARTSSIPEQINIPLLTNDATPENPDEELLSQEQPLAKLAAALAGEKEAFLDQAAKAVPQPIVDAIPDISTTKHPLLSWQGAPAGFAAGALGTAGGWTLMDWLAKHRRKREQEQEVEDARNEFREALSREYQTAMQAKAADSDEPDELDALYAAWRTKQADAKQVLANIANAVGGLYGATALGVGLGSGYGAYKWTKNRSARKLLEKAIEARARQRAAPQPVYAVPTHDLTAV